MDGWVTMGVESLREAPRGLSEQSLIPVVTIYPPIVSVFPVVGCWLALRPGDLRKAPRSLSACVR